VATIRISIINESSLVASAEVQTAAAALQRQVSEHFAPAWGVDAALALVATGAKPPSGSWWLVILDDSDQAGALGYHDLTDEAMPLGKVFVKTAQAAGVRWTITASHELLELLADPSINLTVCTTENNNLVLYAMKSATHARPTSSATRSTAWRCPISCSHRGPRRSIEAARSRSTIADGSACRSRSCPAVMPTYSTLGIRPARGRKRQVPRR